jgi:hypothetical protein
LYAETWEVTFQVHEEGPVVVPAGVFDAFGVLYGLAIVKAGEGTGHVDGLAEAFDLDLCGVRYTPYDEGRSQSLQQEFPNWYAEGIGLVQYGVGDTLRLTDTNVTAVGDRSSGLVRTLAQNYPNPFNPVTTISFALERHARVTLSIHDVEGKLVNTIIDGTLEEGPHQVAWYGTDSRGYPVGSGVYFYRLTAGGEVLTKKMVLLK